MTKDGHLVCMHDDSVDRTTNGTGKVKDLTLSEIKQLNADDGEEVPTLIEVFNYFGKSIKYYIETKKPHVYPGMENKIIQAIKEYNLKEQVIVQSFSSESLLYFPDIFTVYLCTNPITVNFVEVAEFADGIGTRFSNLTKNIVNDAHRYNLVVHPWTVNEVPDMERMIDWNVDGLFTDYPDRAINVINDNSLRI